VPWAPELFSAPALQRVLDQRRRDRLRSVPFFDGLVSGEIDALVGSFSGVPEVHHPLRGRIRGEAAFRRYVADTASWLAALNADVEDVALLLTGPRGVEEVVLHLDDGTGGRNAVPMAVAADRDAEGRIVELRQYSSTVPLIGRRVHRAPLLQPDADLALPDAAGAFAQALTAGGIALEACTVTDDGATCALEYNLVAEGAAGLAPEAGLAVFVRADGGGLATTRVYADAAASIATDA
jgi:hypothetical protein